MSVPANQIAWLCVTNLVSLKVYYK